MKDVLNTCIRETLHALGVEGETYAITRPDTAEHGEYTTNAALLSAKQLGTSPMEIAELLKKKLEALEHTAIEKVTVAPPGFLNIHLSRDFFCATAREACELGAQWGSNTDETGREVLIEYMSPNLFKSLHVGNLVGTTVGESLSRLFEVSGARVHRITYPSDIGLTVAKAVWGLRHENGNPEDIESLGAAYRLGSEAYDSDATAKRDIDAVNAALYTGTDTELMAMRETGKQTSLAHITDICRMFDTTFSETIFESEAAPVGLQAVREHTADGIFTEDAGAVIFRGERHDLHTRVFVNTAGFPTYEAKDLGNFSIKQDRFPEWDISLVVTGNEQREYFQVINAAIREVFSVDEAKVLEHVATGFLTLTGGKMSSRKGTVLTADSVITELCQEAMARVATMRTADVKKLSEQIAVGALKWWILRRQVSGNSVFDRARAFSFEGIQDRTFSTRTPGRVHY